MPASVYHPGHAPVEPGGRADRRDDPDVREDAPPRGLPPRRGARGASRRGDLLHRSRVRRVRCPGRRARVGDDRRRRGAGRGRGPCRARGGLRSPLRSRHRRRRRPRRAGDVARSGARLSGRGRSGRDRGVADRPGGRCHVRGDRLRGRSRRQVGGVRVAPPPLRPAQRHLRGQDPGRRAPDRAPRRAPPGGDRAGVRAVHRGRLDSRDAHRRHRRDRGAGPRGSPWDDPPAPVPPAPVHAGVARRGRGGDHDAPGSRGLDRGQVRRDSRPAPPARSGRTLVQPRPQRRERAVPGGGDGRDAPRLGRGARRRAPGIPRRRGAPVPGAPAAPGSEGALRRAPGRGAGRVRRLRRAGARPARRHRGAAHRAAAVGAAGAPGGPRPSRRRARPLCPVAPGPGRLGRGARESTRRAGAASAGSR